jgi:hypothetical protein
MESLQTVSGSVLYVTAMTESRQTNVEQLYRVSIHVGSSRLTLVPSTFVDDSGLYRPSVDVGRRIEEMWCHRRPRVIGLVSELLASEILTDGQICVSDDSLMLVCQALRRFAEVSAFWKPEFGMYCDDLVTIAQSSQRKLLFVTEVKGTTLQEGLSRSSEAKMFYQLARTYKRLKQKMPFNSNLRLSGAITVAITHSWKAVTLNVLDEKATLGFFPDPWMYGSE